MDPTRPANITEVFAPSFEALVSSIYQAVLYNLGEITIRGAAPITPQPDIARFNIGLLELLRGKCRGNLTEEEALFLAETIVTARSFLDKHTAGITISRA